MALTDRRPLTLLDGERAVTVEARVVGDRAWLSPEALEHALGWELSEEGLCRDALCVPIPPGTALLGPDGVDLAALADVLDRPLALDLDERVVCLGASARDRARALATLEAPNFTLPDLAGRAHALREHRGAKVLLVVWASW